MYTKLKTTLLAFIISITVAMSQAPNIINYQGVAANSAGAALANQNIRVRLKIHNSTATGTIQYSEVRTLTTDATGLFNIQIGSAGAVSTTGSWAGITWDNGAKYLQVEVDPAGGTSYVNMGTQQLVSVPYAQFSKQAGALSSTATITPSQISAGGATTGQVLQFNGTSWIPAVLQQGSSFTLPYNASDANTVSFGITNSNAVGGSALYGKTTTNAVNANGVLGETNAVNGNGVHGKAASISSIGVLGENTTGYGVKGTTVTTSTSGAAVYGLNNGTQGNGVLGVANFASGNGVQGSSTTGIGVKGYSNSNYAVFGSTLTGIALKGFSYGGYGLDVDGKVKIAGGNTNPGAGKVLTSDATGNATWQPVPQATKIAFRATGSNCSYPPSMHTTVNYQAEEYDYGSVYNPTTYRFTAPVSGVYHFDAHTGLLQNSSVYNMSDVDMQLRLERPGNTVKCLVSSRSPIENLGSSGSRAHVSISTDVKLQAGDMIYVTVYQYCYSFTPATTNIGSFSGNTDYFSGHLLFAE